MAMSVGHMTGSMERLARKTQAYYANAEMEVAFDEADRAAAGEADVQKRKGDSLFNRKK